MAEIDVRTLISRLRIGNRFPTLFYGLRNSSDSLAMFAAMRRASAMSLDLLYAARSCDFSLLLWAASMGLPQ